MLAKSQKVSTHPRLASVGLSYSHPNPRLVHPFFSKPSASDSSTAFRWLKPALGPKRTCLHGIHLDPPARPKVALFDLDGTVIKWNHKNRGKGTEALKWEWWRQSVPTKLKALHQDGCVCDAALTNVFAFWLIRIFVVIGFSVQIRDRVDI